jgi:hypothetical protein
MLFCGSLGWEKPVHAPGATPHMVHPVSRLRVSFNRKYVSVDCRGAQWEDAYHYTRLLPEAKPRHEDKVSPVAFRFGEHNIDYHAKALTFCSLHSEEFQHFAA